MKLSARKTHSSFKKAASKTGGGTRPPTPDNITTEIKDLLNPAEFLKDHNIFDSDGYDAILSTSENEKLNAEDICVPGPSQGRDIFIIETVDEQFDTADTEHTPLLELPTVNTSNPTIQPNKCMITPNKAFYNSSTKKRKCSSANITISKKDTDYRTAIINHSNGLKDEEHRRRMEMAEEEHQLKIKILQETLQCSKIEN
ncbi:uncharacterized protein isoform X1 [Choristoneura fumiferana]|uniref:uncharacterized protein isoform X1 n=1 Tax=Choristoneura fumiferana TaxID=7141 RepID=UPI003D15AA29